MRELQDVAVAGAVATNPDVAGRIDRDAVVRGGPLEALALPRLPAPGVHEISFGVELEDRRGRGAAFAGLGVGVEPGLGTHGEGRVAAMDDEHMVARVDANADGGAEDPVVRERLGPHRVHFEGRRLHRLLTEGGGQGVLSDAKRNRDCGEGPGNDPGAANRHGVLLGRGARWLERRQRRILDVAR